MRHRIILIAALIVLLIAIYVYKKRLDAIESMSTAQMPTAVSTDTATSSEEAPAALVKNALETESMKDKSVSIKEKLDQLNLKNLEQIREEVKSNPHRTPPTVIRTAIELGSAYDSVKNEDEAKQFIDKMKSCSHKDEDTYTPIKAACLHYARKIANKYPQLESAYKDLRVSTSPEALKVESQSVNNEK